jgi:hypothetical protein
MVDRVSTKCSCCHLQGGDSGPYGLENPAWSFDSGSSPLLIIEVRIRCPSGVRPETFVSGRRFPPDVLKQETMATQGRRLWFMTS